MVIRTTAPNPRSVAACRFASTWVYAATVAVYSRDAGVKWQQGVRDNSLCSSVYN